MKLARLVLISAAMFCLAQPLRAELADGIEVVVSDSVITYSQVREFAAPAVDALRNQYANDPDAFNRQLNQTLSDSVEQLVERELILHDFTENYKLPDSYVDELVQDRIRDQFGNDRVTFMKTLQAQGETLEQFRQDVRDQYVISALRREKISQQIIISPYKIEQYYFAHTNDFKVEDEVKLRMIVLNKTSPDDTNTLALAREIRTKIKEGAAFAQMASVYSQGSQQQQGGDWGWVQRSVLRKELADVAFKLKAGQMSDVIDLPDACYLVLVEQTRPAHIKPIGDVRDDIEATLRARQQKQIEQRWIARLKEKTFIQSF